MLRGARVGLVFGLLACTRAPQTQTHEIAIRNFGFLPDTLRLHEGDSVIWRNYDFAPHTATAANHAWDSGSLATNASWGRTSLGVGQHAYICAFHPNMTGVLVVE
jgi:plastocyanin